MSKEKYWDWLKDELVKAWKIIKIMPFVFWDLFKWIGSSLKIVSFSEIASYFSWENLCVLSGSLCSLVFIFWLLIIPITTWIQDLLMGALDISLFLISTYAYWRGKPDE